MLSDKVNQSANAMLNSIKSRVKTPNISILQTVRNPFLNANGELVNKYINYQKVLDNPGVASVAKKYITQATGLTPTQNATITSATPGVSTLKTEKNGNKTVAFASEINSNMLTSGSEVVDTAKKYLGTPYVWGGSTPSGFDCSGLVQYAYAQNGISIPRTSQEQYKVGTAVSQTELQPGDLVFFRGSGGTNSAPGHVGMYVGNNQYIQAPKTGDVVKISDLSARNDYTGARRIK